MVTLAMRIERTYMLKILKNGSPFIKLMKVTQNKPPPPPTPKQKKKFLTFRQSSIFNIEKKIKIKYYH